ncbi:hypothetical protein BX600DRAFT_402732 [Xylariales sp. PMI_506]|nr:hypothetical protein BX600DRAFT_402732 [Xylariales sp. PMI_506]
MGLQELSRTRHETRLSGRVIYVGFFFLLSTIYLGSKKAPSENGRVHGILVEVGPRVGEHHEWV